jgi:hypothetical protein
MSFLKQRKYSIHQKYIPLYGMKSLSLKLDENIYNETERITKELQCARNRYINEALDLYNKYNKRQLLKKKLKRESLLVRAESMKILAEFEKLEGRNETV